MYVLPATIVSSYHHSPSAISVYNDVHNLSCRSFNGKVLVTLFLKTWSNDAEKNTTCTNILSFNMHTITFMCIFGNGDFHYNCFLLSLSMKGGDLDVLWNPLCHNCLLNYGSHINIIRVILSKGYLHLSTPYCCYMRPVSKE
jgi:hypothetical protein